MIEFERHITKLLLNNDCVIVPGFGGFMAHHIAAYFDKDSHLFYPPHRTLGFNPQLTMNDSLLVQSFIEYYDISYPEALDRIENNVNELKHILETEGRYEMCGLGILALNAEGKYDFTPCEAGIATPCLYGLDVFEMPQQEKATTALPSDDKGTQRPQSAITVGNATTMTSEQNMPDEDQTGQAPSSPIHRTVPLWLLRDLAAACIVIMAVIFLPTPTHNGTQRIRSGQIDTNLFLKMMPKDITTGEPQAKDIKPAKTVKPLVTPSATQSHVKDDISPSSAYTIVLASRVTRSGAEAWVKKLRAQGYSQARVLTEAAKTKVVYGSYPSLEEANEQLRHLTDNEELANSWIMHTPQH